MSREVVSQNVQIVRAQFEATNRRDFTAAMDAYASKMSATLIREVAGSTGPELGEAVRAWLARDRALAGARA